MTRKADDAVGVCTVTAVNFVHAATTLQWASLLQGSCGKKWKRRACSSCAMKNSQFDACGIFLYLSLFSPLFHFSPFLLCSATSKLSIKYYLSFFFLSFFLKLLLPKFTVYT